MLNFAVKMDIKKNRLVFDEALSSLNKHQLTAAEKSFIEILNDFQDACNVQTTPELSTSCESSNQSTEEAVVLVIETLSGLSEIQLKRARIHRFKQPFDWFKHSLRSLAYFQQIIRLCDSSAETCSSSLWYQRSKYEQKLKELSGLLSRHLEEYIIAEHEGKLCLQTHRLQDLVQHLQQEEAPKVEVETHIQEPDCKVEDVPPPPKKKFIEFGKLHKAVSTLVRNVSRDIRRRYHRKKLSEDTLRRSVSCELVSILSPLNDDDDILNLFEQIIKEEEEMEALNAPHDAVAGCSKEPHSAPTSPKKRGSEDFTARSSKATTPPTPSRTPSRQGTPSRQLKPTTPQITPSKHHMTKTPSCSRSHTPKGTPSHKSNSGAVNLPLVATGNLHIIEFLEHSPSSEGSKTDNDELCSVDIINILDQPFSTGPNMATNGQDDPYLLPGVLTVWKRFEKHRPQASVGQCRSYRLPGFEEVSPLTEGSPCRLGLGGVGASEPAFLAEQPPLASVLLLAFSWQLTSLASQLEQRGQGNIAIEVLKFALGLVHKAEDRGLNALIVQQLGLIRIAQGDVSGGLQLLDEARQRFESSNLRNWSIHVAEIYLQQGKAYLLSENNHGQTPTIFDYVLQVVRDRMDSAEFTDITFDNVSPSNSENDSDSSQGDSYAPHVHEAAECFQNCLTELQTYIDSCRRQHLKMYEREQSGALMIDALVCLGDCYTLMGDFSRAVSAYEEALTHCKEVVGTQAVRLNSHLLLMLGVANYLLGNLPKAAIMMETAHILRSHCTNYSGKREDFEAFFTLCMLATTLHHMGQPHRCIVWCLKAYELFRELYQEGGLEDCEPSPPAPFIQQWFVLHCLLNLGHAYYLLDFYDRAVKYLHTALCIVNESAIQTDTRQNVRILKILGDCRAAEDQYDEAISIYQEALDKLICLGNTEHASASLQNQLFNSMAAARVNLHQYSEAAACLEQALGHQRQVECSIQGDLIGLEYQLGITYMMSGEVDKAIDCFEDCLEAVKGMSGSSSCEDAGTSSADISPIHSVSRSVTSSDNGSQTRLYTLTKLGILYHVKALMQEDSAFMNDLLSTACDYHLQAAKAYPMSSATVHAAFFLWQQEKPDHALLLLMPIVFNQVAKRRLSPRQRETVFAGVGQALLPDYLQTEVDNCSEEVSVNTVSLAMFIAAKCFIDLNLLSDAMNVMELMYQKAETAQDFALLGYIIMEFGAFGEAAMCFQRASQLKQEIHFLDRFHYAFFMCLLLHVNHILSSVCLAVALYHGKLPVIFNHQSEIETTKDDENSNLDDFHDQPPLNSNSLVSSLMHTSLSSAMNDSSDYSMLTDSSGLESSDGGYISTDSFHNHMTDVNTSHMTHHDDTAMSQSGSEEEEDDWVVLEEGTYHPADIEEGENENYEPCVDPSSTTYEEIVNKTVQDLQAVVGTELNANYSELYDLVDQQLRTNWKHQETMSKSNMLENVKNSNKADSLDSPRLSTSWLPESPDTQQVIPGHNKNFEYYLEKSQGYLDMFGPRRSLGTPFPDC